MPQLTIISNWIGLFIVDVSVMLGGISLLSHSFINAFLLFNMAMVFALLGVWITLQFKWVSSYFPNLFTAMERLLLSTVIYPAAVLLTWTSIVIQGIDNAPLTLCAILCVLYYMYGLPLRSFRLRASKPVTSVNDFILGRLESGLMTATVIFFPALFHYAIHHYTILSSGQQMTHLFLLITTPATFVFALAKHGSLWWILPKFWNQKISSKQYAAKDSAGYAAVFRIGSIIKIACLFVLVGCIEYRILYNSTLFTSRYLSSTFSVAMVTLAMYSAAAIFYALVISERSTDIISSTIRSDSLPLHILASCFAASFTYILSAPIFIYPVSIGAAVSLTRYLATRQALPYNLFVITSASCLQWFIHNNFWFIKDYSFGPISLHTFTYLISALFIVSMLSIRALGLPLLGALLVVQALLLTIIETLLHASGQTEMYPAYLICITSLLGLFLNHKLFEGRSLNIFMKTAADSFYIAKFLALILHPIEESIIPCFLFTVTIYSLYSPDAKRISREMATVQFISSALVSLLFVHEVPWRIISMFISHTEATLPLLFACFLVSFSICIFGLSFRFFPESRPLRSLIVFMFCSGLILLLFGPTSSSQSTISGPAWSNWLAILAIVIFMLGVVYRTTLSRSSLLKPIFALSVGTLLGLFISINYFVLHGTDHLRGLPKRASRFSGNTIIHALIVLLFDSFALLLSYTHWPSLYSPNYMTALYSFFLALFPIAYILLGSAVSPSAHPSPRIQAHLDNTRLSIAGLCIGLNLVLVVYLKYKVSTLKIKSTPITASPLKKPGQAGSTGSKLDGNDWIFGVSNFACIFCLVASVTLNVLWLNGSELCLFVLSPMLLLLNTERGRLRKLSESHRYAPICMAISLILLLFAAIELIATASNTAMSHEWTRFFGLSSGFWRFWWNIKNWTMLITTLPSVYYINNYLWKFERQAQFTWLILSPPALLAALFSDINAINYLGVVGIAGAITQNFKLKRKLRTFFSPQVAVPVFVGTTAPTSPTDHREFLTQLATEIDKINLFMQDKENEIYQRYVYLVSRFKAMDFTSPFSSFLYLVATSTLPVASTGYKEINSMLAFQKAFEDLNKQIADLDQFARNNVWAIQKLLNTYAKKSLKTEHLRRRGSFGESHSHLVPQHPKQHNNNKGGADSNPNSPIVLRDATTTDESIKSPQSDSSSKSTDGFFEDRVAAHEIGHRSNLKKITLEIEKEFQAMSTTGLYFLNNALINFKSAQEKALSTYVTSLCQNVINNRTESLKEDIIQIKKLMTDMGINNDVGMWREALCSCIHKASYLGHLEPAKLLFEAFGSIVNIHHTDEVDKQFIHIAAENGHSEFIAYLLSRGAQLDCEDYVKRTPLHLAARGRHLDAAALLLERGANSNTKDREGCTPLFLASRSDLDNGPVIGLLLSHKSSVTHGPNGRNPLHEAAIHCNLRNMTALLSHPDANIDVNVIDSFGRTPLYESSRRGDIDSLDTLLARDARIDVTDEDKRTPLHEAAAKGQCGTLQKLIAHYQKTHTRQEVARLVNTADEDGWTPFHDTAYANYIDCTRVLLEAGANPFAQDKGEWSPIVHSLYRGNIQTAITIMDYAKRNDILDSSFSTTPTLRDSRGIMPPLPRGDLARSTDGLTSSIDAANRPLTTTSPRIVANPMPMSHKKIPKSLISNVTFKIIAAPKPGQRVGIIGNRKALGSWQPSHALFLREVETVNGASGEGIWVGKASVPTNVSLEYKYIICDDSGRLDMWEALPSNRTFIPEEEEVLIEDGTFGHAELDEEAPPPVADQTTPAKTLFVEKGWLVNDTQVRVRFGETTETDPQRRIVSPIKLYGEVEVGRIVVTMKGRDHANVAGTQPTQITMPVHKDQTITFQTNDIDSFTTLQFDMYRRGMSSVMIGRAVMLASDLIKHAPYTVTLPIFSTTLVPIGEVTFFPLVVSPFTHARIADVLSSTYWKSTLLIGHRGGGAENARSVGKYKRTHIKENTILSFVTAASLGAQYIEFDVQLSRDNVPLIYHDWEMSAAGGTKIPINRITLAALQSLVPPAPTSGTAKRVPLSANRARSRSMQDLFISNNEPVTEPVPTQGHGHEAAPGSYISDSMTTLEETFKRVPEATGFNIEIKYPDIEKETELRLNNVSRNAYVDAILAVVFEHAGNRQVMFSSFDPDICVITALKQPRYPVFFLSNAGFTQHSDPRQNSISEAIRFSRSAHILGIVTNSRILTEGPPIISEVKLAGLMLCSWGEENNDPAMVELQENLGVDAVIVDHVAYVSKHYNGTTSSALSSSTAALNLKL
eukprot:gene4303-5026_t